MRLNKLGIKPIQTADVSPLNKSTPTYKTEVVKDKRGRKRMRLVRVHPKGRPGQLITQNQVLELIEKRRAYVQERAKQNTIRKLEKVS